MLMGLFASGQRSIHTVKSLLVNTSLFWTWTLFSSPFYDKKPL